MGSLPFIVEPRLSPVIDKIGTEESGIIEIRRQGYLSVSERNFVQQIQRSDSSTQLIIKLSRSISGKYQIGLDKAYQVAMAALGGDAVSDDLAKYVPLIESEFDEEISATINGLTQLQAQAELVEALCMIINRVDANFTPSEIAKVHPDLITALSSLYRDELNKSTERIKELQEENGTPIEEIEKKPSTRKKSG
jgi:hypothetical protein